MVSLIVAWFALAVAVGTLWAVYRGSPGPHTGESPAYDDSELRSAVIEVAEGLDELRADYSQFHALVTEAVDNGIREIKRKENRIRATVRRAREELEDSGIVSPGLQAEARELLEGDGARGDEGRMQAVRDDMADPQQGNRFAAFPGDWQGYGG